MAHEGTGAVRLSLDKRGTGAIEFSFALVGRHVVRWLRRRMSSIWSLKRRCGFMTCFAIVTRMLTWDSYYYQEDDRRCAYKIK